MFLKPAHSNLCCPQASPSGRIRHPRARPTRRIVASSLLCVRGAEVESKPQRLEQRSPAIQGGSNWISLAMVKPNPESKLEIDVVVLKLSIEVNLRCENTRLMQQ
uniref:Uncharacterized protein n=1 Tax=Phytophthora fragariae TaxID=53985 RepID=A0A6A3FWA8_9STRA|nr:hypothetical protein PF009_g664 [Phytophthora fragariae]